MTTRPNELHCPECGERELLRGRRAEGSIEVTCGRCAHTWLRQERGCATCGGTRVVERDQYLRRNPRGNQIAVVGRRVIRLCPTCDRDALVLADTRSGMVEEGYASRYLVDDRTRAVPRSAPDPEPAPKAPPVAAEATTPPPGPAAAPPAAPVASPTASPTPAASMGTTDPTLREAIASFLEGPAEPGDGLVMLLVGRDLGVTTRLSTLAADPLDRVSRSGGETPAAAGAAARAVAHWRSRGWLPA